MKIVVVDTETTGIGEEDRVVEIAVVMVELVGAEWTQVGPGYACLVKPAVPVSVGARATHHITDAELAGADAADAVAHRLGAVLRPPGAQEEVVFAAHNAEFDRRMMTQSGMAHVLPARTVCTWKCALHLYPDAPAHSNQVLRYYLDLVVPPVDGPPHRALPDAVVTARLLLKMLETTPAEELVRLTTAPVLLKTIRFGKHRDRKWEDVDSDYLQWILRSDFGPDEKHTARHWLDHRRNVREAKRPPDLGPI